MNVDTTGAVIVLEARVSDKVRARSPGAVQAGFEQARRVMGSLGGGASFAPEPGESFAGTLTLEDPAEAFAILHRLRTNLRSDPQGAPVQIIAGLARGRGPDAVRRAADALRSIRRKKKRYTHATVAHGEDDRVLDALVKTIDSLVGGWTAAQWQAIHRRDRGSTLQQIGEELRIAYQNVSKRLIAARYSLYRDVVDAASLVFSKSIRS